MSEREITHFEDVDVDKLKQSFNEWIDKFLDQQEGELKNQKMDTHSNSNSSQSSISQFNE